jgi:hypothetical protein
MVFRVCIYDNKTPLSNILTGAKTAICVQLALDAMYNNKIVTWKPEYDAILNKT